MWISYKTGFILVWPPICVRFYSMHNARSVSAVKIHETSRNDGVKVKLLKFVRKNIAFFENPQIQGKFYFFPKNLFCLKFLSYYWVSRMFLFCPEIFHTFLQSGKLFRCLEAPLLRFNYCSVTLVIDAMLNQISTNGCMYGSFVHVLF